MSLGDLIRAAWWLMQEGSADIREVQRVQQLRLHHETQAAQEAALASGGNAPVHVPVPEVRQRRGAFSARLAAGGQTPIQAEADQALIKVKEYLDSKVHWIGLGSIGKPINPAR